MDKIELIKKEKGLIPPNAIDVEQSVLSAVMIDSKCVDEVLMIIKTPDFFYKDQHKYIYEAIKSLFSEGQSIDLITVSQRLRSLGTLEKSGGDFYLIEITRKVASGAHVEFWCRILVQKFIAREVIKFNYQTTALAYDETTDVFELMNGLQNSFDALANLTIAGKKMSLFSESLDRLHTRIEYISSVNESNALIGVNTGFAKVDKFTGGYNGGELIILAARPGMGKTSLVLKTAVENVKNDNPVGFISLEMSESQLTARIVAIDSDFHLSQLIKTGFDKPKYFESFANHKARMSKYNLYIDDSAESDINSVVLKARYMKRVFGIKILIIDYLQLMTNSLVKGNREQEISSISRRLKLLSKELDIPVIVLSQLSRAVETRGSSKRPLLSDLRESGSLEQDADIVQFIFRPEYYKIDIHGSEEYEQLVNENCNTEFIFAKYRNGSVATCGLKWIGDKTKFEDPTEPIQVYDQNISNDLPVINPNEAFDVNNSNVASAEWFDEE